MGTSDNFKQAVGVVRGAEPFVFNNQAWLRPVDQIKRPERSKEAEKYSNRKKKKKDEEKVFTASPARG
jgi:hypothetical protein